MMLRERITQGIGWAFTEGDFRRIAAAYGGEFLNCHSIPYMAYDVVGDVRCQQAMERQRFPGIVFRYFNTHQERLAELQQRIDAAKRKNR